MLQRAIPSTGERVPVVGIGSWIQFDVGPEAPERGGLKQVLRTMYNHGATVIDSSPMYGRSEQVIGELVNEINLAAHFFYATKVWTSGRQAGIDQMNTSLKKMQRKQLDLLQIHNLVDWQTQLTTLRQWKAEGKTRYIGITHYVSSAHAQLEQIIQAEIIDFVQFNYSIGIRDAEKSLLQTAMDRGVAVIINEPLKKGNLFKQVKSKPLPAWAGDYGISSWGQFFLKYIISHPAVTCAIPGTSNPLHIEDNIAAGNGPMPGEKERIKMAALFDSL